MVKEYILDIFFPRRCPVCDDIVMPKGQLICPRCKQKLSYIKQPTCMKCGKMLKSFEQEYCYDCTKKRHTYRQGISLLQYDSIAKKSLAAFKYHNKREYGDFYVAEICERYGKKILSWNPDALIPIPVHPSRKRKRGFNQAEILADGIGKILNIPVVTNALLRIKKTLPQKNLNDRQRLDNLKSAFGATIAAKGLTTVILVDDIYTTGSTMEACTVVLKNAGVKNVYFISVSIGYGM